MSQNTETTADTLLAATQKKALPTSKLALLGTIIKPDSVKALVRLGHSDVQTVTIGDPVNGATVTAIDEGLLILTQDAQTRRLTFPDT